MSRRSLPSRRENAAPRNKTGGILLLIGEITLTLPNPFLPRAQELDLVLTQGGLWSLRSKVT